MKRWRTKANVSREELAAAANYSPDTIKSMEQGVRMPTHRVLDTADELCRAEGLLSAAKEYLQREKFPGAGAGLHGAGAGGDQPLVV
jgi:transcriptional regulator with XRE-family HTH domain